MPQTEKKQAERAERRKEREIEKKCDEKRSDRLKNENKINLNEKRHQRWHHIYNLHIRIAYKRKSYHHTYTCQFYVFSTFNINTTVYLINFHSFS